MLEFAKTLASIKMESAGREESAYLRLKITDLKEELKKKRSNNT